ncbi:MAG: restriction endonuclease subunit S [Succinivibrio sp.]|nr:restriction endonuclease subunit S [Succinivibrio sp.]
MSEVVYKSFPLNELFVPKNGNSKYTKVYCNNNKGNYPLYSANTEKEFSFINSFDYDGKYITWAKDGLAGYLMVNEGKFSITGHRGILIPKEERNDIDINYLKFILEPIFRKAIKGRVGDLGKNEYTTINPDMIKKLKIFIPFPVNAEGAFDIDKQRELASIYYEINEKRKKLLERIKEIERLSVLISMKKDLLFKDVPLNKIVEHCNGNAKYTKQWCKNNEGNFPVYSANNYEPISYVNHYDYDGEYLTYSKNGCAGYISIISGKFSVNGDRCVMPINSDYKDIIDILYLKYYLEPVFRTNKKGRLGDLGKNEFTKLNSNMIKKLNIQVPIPIKTDGTYDLEKQKEIANKYRLIDEIKQGLIEKIKSLVEIKIVPSE